MHATTMTPVRGIVFDFNGTLSDDEPILYEIFRELFAEQGRPLSAQEYYDELAGLSDPEIVLTWLGRDQPNVDEIVAERVERYRAAVSDGSSIHEHVREAVRFAAERVPLAICSGAARAEIIPVVAAAELASCFRGIVSSDDVVHGKPHPEGHLKALELLDGAAAADRPAPGEVYSRLEEALDLMRGRMGVMAEIKTPNRSRKHAIVTRTVQLLADDDVLVCFQRAPLVEARAVRPGLRTVQHVGFGTSIRAAKGAWAAGFFDPRTTRRGIAAARNLRLEPLVYTANQAARTPQL